MTFQHKPDSGSIFKNDKKEKDSQPGGKGDALIGGVEYWVSAWTNDGPKGKYQTLKFERKDKQTNSTTHTSKLSAEEDDSLPPF